MDGMTDMQIIWHSFHYNFKYYHEWTKSNLVLYASTYLQLHIFFIPNNIINTNSVYKLKVQKSQYIRINKFDSVISQFMLDSIYRNHTKV